MKEKIKRILDRILYTATVDRIYRNQRELIYAAKCDSAFYGNPWLVNRAFNPGGWAIGWPGLYIIYRTLEALKPMNILEMGLGETTKMISQYAAYVKPAHHFIVEHDKDWISFFEGNLTNSEIVHCELEYGSYDNIVSHKKVCRYKELEKELDIRGGAGIQYNLIVIDGPFGSEGVSRIDVLDLLPNHLAKDFAIIFDDTERAGEKETINLIQRKLEENSIEYAIGEYEGTKTTTIICSKDYKFLSSLQS